MNIDEYLFENESVTEQVSAYDDVDAVSSSNEGTLACTPCRLVYIGGDDIIDISISEVNSIEYTGPSYPEKYLNWGVGAVVSGFLLFVSWIVVEYTAAVLGFGRLLLIISAMVSVIGIVILIQGYVIRRASLNIHTPNKSYEFVSKRSNLDEIGHTVRAYEMKNNQHGAY